jgi:metal-dependent amidase/aminoacylase/carboxypeptidase family protein
MVNNMTLARRFGVHLTAVGRAPRETDTRVGSGSTDMGDVSHAVPSIHPWIAICDEGETTCHQHAFQQCAGSERGMQGMLAAAKAMALTAAELLTDATLLAAVKDEFAARG